MKQIDTGRWKGRAWKKGSASQLQRDQANNRKKVVIVFFSCFDNTKRYWILKTIYLPVLCHFFLPVWPMPSGWTCIRRCFSNSIFGVCQRQIEFVLRPFNIFFHCSYNNAQSAKCQRKRACEMGDNRLAEDFQRKMDLSSNKKHFFIGETWTDTSSAIQMQAQNFLHLTLQSVWAPLFETLVSIKNLQFSSVSFNPFGVFFFRDHSSISMMIKSISSLQSFIPSYRIESNRFESR